MKAVVIDKYDSFEDIRISEIDKPLVKSGEVLVKVMAFSVNSGDERIRSLNFKGLPIPFWLINPLMQLVIGIGKPRKTLGTTFSGVIEKLGEGVTNFRVGDEIYAMTGARFGAFAEYAVVKSDHCIALKPKKASFAQAAAIPFGATTAMHFLRKANIDNAKKVLIYGSTGAVGVAAVQIAVYKEAEVTAVCGSDGVTLSKKLGAIHVFDYKKQNVNDSNDTYDIIFDAVGHTSKNACNALLAESGRYISVMGFESAKELTDDLECISKLYDEGKFIAVIDSIYKLKNITDAFKRVSTGHKKGSVVVTIHEK